MGCAMSDRSRRRFLQLGIGGVVSLALGGSVLRWIKGGYHLAKGDVAIGLSVKQLTVVRAIVDALAPGENGWPSGLALGVHRSVDEQFWAADPALSADLRAGLELIEHVPPLFGHFGRLSSLDREARQEVYARLLESRFDVLVQVATAMKQLVLLCYYTREEVWPFIGYDGPWIKQAKPPESALAYAELVRKAGAA
jgi:hypothetical protein